MNENVTYFAMKLLRVVLTVLGIMTILFFMLQLGSDPAAIMAGPGATDEMIAATRVRLGLDQPVILQYVTFLRGIVTGDFGLSFVYQQPALGVVLRSVPASLAIVLPSIVLSVILGIGIGVAAATSRYRRISSTIMTVTFLGQAVPFFWLGIVFMLIFGLKLRWLPAVGSGGIEHLVLPVAAITVSHLAALSRLTRGEVSDMLHRPFVTTARSKGLSRGRVIWRHAVPNALPPVVSWCALTFAFAMGQLLIVEPLFAYHGLGYLVISAVKGQDFPLVEAGVFVIATIVALATVLADIVNAMIDTSLKSRGQKA
ncbi:ABC transporter permease [Martelella sp. HB161492]|uniref:ABC transporter permease n=1 Tax=Martelella sp. HB161492 TaxID=2720726 RepID=UPI001590CA53|nr:ABC transporter permease [Martelella sp. HB161492]